MIRDPKHPNWPDEGERTEFEDVAREWAWAYVRALQARKHARQRGEPAPTPELGKAVPEFLRHREATRAENTWASDKSVLNNLLRYYGSTKHLAELTDDAVQRWVDDRVRQGYKPATMRQYVQTVRVMMEWAGLEPPEVTIRETGDEWEAVALTDPEIRALRRQADRMEIRELFERGLNTGMRRNELVAVHYEDFNTFSRTVVVSKQVKRSGHGTKPPKGKRIRTALVLPEYWPHFDREGTGRMPSPHYDTLTKYFRDMIVSAGFAHLVGHGVHLLRHTYARLYLERHGGDLLELASYLGHASVETTRRYYQHFSTEAAIRIGRGKVYGDE